MEKIVHEYRVLEDGEIKMQQANGNTSSMMVKSGSLVRVTVIEPEKKKLEWSKIPVNTVVSVSDDGENWLLRHFFRQATDGRFQVFANGTSKDTGAVNFDYRHCKLIEQTTFTYWPGGGCPLSDGVMVECVFIDDGIRHTKCFVAGSDDAWNNCWDSDPLNGYQKIIAYRIIGLADGWEY